MTVPDDKLVKGIICAWAKKNPRITKAHLYGSFLTRKTWPPNDIDIALEINDVSSETGFTYWICEGNELARELGQLIGYKVHVELLDGMTPTVKQGIEAEAEVVYQR